MNTQKIVMPILQCLLFASTAIAETDTPARDYRMVNFDNGITSTMLEIGKTSLTFSVEWSIDTDVSGGTMFLIGKLNAETECWSFLGELVIDPDCYMATVYGEEYVKRRLLEVDLVKRKVVVGILYDHLPWSYFETESSMFTQKAFFSVQKSVGSEEEWEATWGADGWATNGVVEAGINAPPVKAKQDVAQTPLPADRHVSPKREGEEKLEMRNEELGIEKQKEMNRLWLYLAILPFILAILYLIRKKKE